MELPFRFLNNEAFVGLSGLSFGGYGFSSLIGDGLNLVIFLNSGDKSRSALTGSHVLDSHMNSLMDNSIADLLVDDDTQSAGVDVENSASTSVIIFERHTLV